MGSIRMGAQKLKLAKFLFCSPVLSPAESVSLCCGLDFFFDKLWTRFLCVCGTIVFFLPMRKGCAHWDLF